MNIKKIVKYTLVLVIILSFGCIIFTKATTPPNFDDGFVSHLVENKKVYDVVKNVKADRSFKDNVRCLIYPNPRESKICGNSPGGTIWDVARYIMVGVVFLFFVIIGVQLLTSNPESDKDKIKSALKSLYFIAIGALIFFGAVRILGTLLNFGGIQGTSSVVSSLEGGENSLFYRVISLLKTLVFFIAIIMMMVYGFKIMASSDKAEEARKHVRGVANVIIALVLVKVVDYIYYIAQVKDFTTQAKELILNIARILGFIVGIGATLMAFYAGYLLLTDQGKSENMKKAKNIFVNILLVAIVIFIFLLITYQIFAEFGAPVTP